MEEQAVDAHTSGGNLPGMGGVRSWFGGARLELRRLERAIPDGMTTSFIRRAGEPESRRAGEPESRRAGEPESRRAGEPESRRAGEPESRRAGEPESRRAGEPESRRAGEPESRRAGEPESRRAGEPESRRAGEPESRRAGEPESRRAGEPESRRAGEPESRRAGEPESRRAGEPESRRAGEPELYHRPENSRPRLSRRWSARHSPAARPERGNFLQILFFRLPAHSVRGMSCRVPGRRGASLSGDITFLNRTTEQRRGHSDRTRKKLPANQSGIRSSK